MNYSDLSSKLTQVIEQIPKDVLYDFCCSYAQEHEELAMALVNEFWRPEKDDYRSMVQQCLMHPTPAGIKNGDGYDWGAIAVDLSRMMNLADEKVKEGRLQKTVDIHPPKTGISTVFCTCACVGIWHCDPRGEGWTIRTFVGC